jgi:hypothetical protein
MLSPTVAPEPGPCQRSQRPSNAGANRARGRARSAPTASGWCGRRRWTQVRQPAASGLNSPQSDGLGLHGVGWTELLKLKGHVLLLLHRGQRRGSLRRPEAPTLGCSHTRPGCTTCHAAMGSRRLPGGTDTRILAALRAEVGRFVRGCCPFAAPAAALKGHRPRGGDRQAGGQGCCGVEVRGFEPLASSVRGIFR